MRKNIILWIVAFLITILTVVYQRATGPTYPLDGVFTLNRQDYQYQLFTSHGGDKDHRVSIIIEDELCRGYIFYKRFKTDDSFTKITLRRNSDTLFAYLPHQPPAGKLEYYLELASPTERKKIPINKNVVIRYKGDVPWFILIPHILSMFGAMFLSTRTGLEIFRKKHNIKKLTYCTLGFLLIGGFILGPLTQHYAFGALWTGFPFGTDLTDNKTAIALLGWFIALILMRRFPKRQNLWAFGASILLLIIFLIPHSLMGSELDYNTLDKQKIIKSIDK